MNRHDSASEDMEIRVETGNAEETANVEEKETQVGEE